VVKDLTTGRFAGFYSTDIPLSPVLDNLVAHTWLRRFVRVLDGGKARGETRFARGCREVRTGWAPPRQVYAQVHTSAVRSSIYIYLTPHTLTPELCKGASVLLRSLFSLAETLTTSGSTVPRNASGGRRAKLRPRNGRLCRLEPLLRTFLATIWRARLTNCHGKSVGFRFGSTYGSPTCLLPSLVPQPEVRT